MTEDLKSDLVSKLRTNATPLKSAGYQKNALGYVIAWEHYVLVTKDEDDVAMRSKLQVSGKAIDENSTVADLVKALNL